MDIAFSLDGEWLANGWFHVNGANTDAGGDIEIGYFRPHGAGFLDNV